MDDVLRLNEHGKELLQWMTEETDWDGKPKKAARMAQIQQDLDCNIPSAVLIPASVKRLEEAIQVVGEYEVLLGLLRD